MAPRRPTGRMRVICRTSPRTRPVRSRAEFVSKFVTLKQFEPNSVFKPQGTSFIIHAGADDHTTDPAGNSGDRIACGTIGPGKP